MVTRDALPFYKANLEVFRAILQAAIITTLALGAASVALLRSKLHGLLGMALGALTLLVIRNGLTLVRVDPLWLQGVYGLVILVAITIDDFVVRRTGRQR